MGSKSAKIKALTKELRKLSRQDVSLTPAAPAPQRPPMRITPGAVDAMRSGSLDADTRSPFGLYEPPPGVLPAGKTASDMALAADWDPGGGGLYNYAQSGMYGQYGWFPGFAALAELAQRAEYRMITETLAEEMTRKWIKLSATGDDDKGKRIDQLTAALDDFGFQEAFRKLSEHDGFFGRGQLFIDLGVPDTKLMTPLVVDPRTIKKGSLQAIRVVEPIWTYPQDYDSANPLAANFYKPQAWYVMGKGVHHTRLLTIISRELPDFLKPAYAFAGLSMSQMAMPYIEKWLRTTRSVERLIHSFSVSGLATNMGSILNSGAATDLQSRAQLFNVTRDNSGLFLCDKETEEFFNVSTPLGTLDHLQAQSQEHMASVSGIPLVKLLGISPSGLNASAEPEIRSFYDKISAAQERVYAKPLRTLIDIVMLHLWGEIDPDITFAFEPLWQLDDVAKAANRKTDVDTAVELINAGVVSAEEERARQAKLEDGMYPGLDPNDLPDPPDMGMEDDPTLLSDPSHGAEKRGSERDGT